MLYQQGDVLIEKAREIPAGVKKKGDFVLVEGEVTGHAHRVMPQGDLITVYEKDGQLFVKAKKSFCVTHEEHKTIEVPDGTYRIRKVKEYDHFAEEAREVRD